MLGRSGSPSLCVITPYYKEDRALLERCLASVRRQTVKVEHILVADGFPQAWIDEAGVRHMKLDRAHGDYGNTGRGLGALMAIAEKFDAIAFLDADNWYEDDHIEVCLRALATKPESAYVIARRDFVRGDGSSMNVALSEDVPVGDHVDTNCYLFLPSAYHLLHYWCTLPRDFSAQGDRLFRIMIKSRLGDATVVTERPTVKYTCLFEVVYRNIGEPPPADAKPSVDWNVGLEWLRGLPPYELPLVDQLSGLSISNLARA